MATKTKVTKSTVSMKTPKVTRMVKKAAVKPVSNVVQPKKETAMAAKVSGLNVSVLGGDGKATGTMTLPKEVFGSKVNKALMAQAIRVYLANQREGGASTKTRGEVEGSTRKIYRQKGTGRARHGSIRAHIFVGGGIVFGPVPHEFTLSMPAKMRQKATISALSSQMHDGNVLVVDGLSDLKPKTKFMAQAMYAATGDAQTLLVLGADAKVVARTARNIANINTVPVHSLNTYDVLTHQKIIFMRDAVNIVKNIFVKEAK